MDKSQTFQGVVIFFDNKKGYGFIEYESNGVKQKDMFVHFSDIVSEGFKSLKKGDKVTFSVGLNNHGDPKACNVTLA